MTAAAWHELGLALARCGRRCGAVAAFRNALQLDDRRAETFLALGRLFVESGCFEHALTSFACAERLGMEAHRRPDLN